MIHKIKEFYEGRKVLKIISMVVGGIFVAILVSFLVGWIVMLLWNWLMPTLFGLGTINYWQGLGIFLLAKLIFGGFGGSSDDSGHKKKKSFHNSGVANEIKKEIKKEFKKEFDKECEKESEKEFNKDYDDKYEQWWEAEGKASFGEYMKTVENETAEHPQED